MWRHREMMALNIGAKVSFESRRDGPQLGTVVKFNRKTVSVVTDDGRHWVSGHFGPFFLSDATLIIVGFLFTPSRPNHGEIPTCQTWPGHAPRPEGVGRTDGGV